MTGSDLIVVAPWIIFGVAVAAVCVRLLFPAPRIPAAGGADLPAVPRSDRPRRFAAPRRRARPPRVTAPGGRRPPSLTGSTMAREEHASPAVVARVPSPATRPAVAGDPGVPLAGPAGGGHRAVTGLSRRRRGPGRLRRRRRPAEGPATAPPHGHGPPEARGRRGRAGPAGRGHLRPLRTMRVGDPGHPAHPCPRGPVLPALCRWARRARAD